MFVLRKRRQYTVFRFTRLTHREGGASLHPCRKEHDYTPRLDPPQFQIQ